MHIPVETLASIDSTNLEAMRRIAAGERGPLWILADEQTAGRGRSGRSWSSTHGNFYGSLILPVACRPAVAHHLSLLMGVAVHDALVEVAAGKQLAGLRLKWPNDVQIGGAKLCGLLPESTQASSGAPGSGLMVVFGIGINFVPPAAPIGRPVASLAEHGVSVPASGMAAALSAWMLHWLGLWRAGEGFDLIRSAWLGRAGPRGEAMSVNVGSSSQMDGRAEAISGVFEGLDADGALLLRLPSGEIRRFTYGDVTLTAAR